MKRLLCVWLPSWPIQRLVIAQPELNGRVVILHARDPRRGQCVVACSRAAYCYGVRPHMSLAEATALQEHAATTQSLSETPSQVSSGEPTVLGNPPHLDVAKATRSALHQHTPYIAEHHPQADAEVLEQLAQWCEHFSPLVGFEHLDPFSTVSLPPQRRTDCLYLDVTHLAPYFGSEHTLARLVAESFSERGYLVRVAVADTLGATWALAHFALQDATRIDRSTDRAMPVYPRTDGLVAPAAMPSAGRRSSFLVVPSEATRMVLSSLPIQALRLPHNIESLLEQLGILRIGQLACLPRASLLSRFGDVLLRRWDQAYGHLDEVLISHHPTAQFQADWGLEHPTTNQHAIQSILGELAEQLTSALGQRGEGVIQCICRLTCTDHPDTAAHALSPPHPLTPSPPHSFTPSSSHPLTLRIGLFQPTACAHHLRQLFQMQLERLFLPGPVERIVLEASRTASLERRQRTLFSDGVRPAAHYLAHLVDRLSSRLGSANVLRAHLHTDAQPEFAYGYLPLTGGGRRQRAARQATRSSLRSRKSSTRTSSSRHSAASRQLIRPLHLRSPPLPLAVVALAPDGPPVQLLLNKRTYRIARCWGPERIETGWWRGCSLRRDYFRLETRSGQWLWVFRQLSDGKWFLHGMFG